jgi:hypothetical protein
VPAPAFALVRRPDSSDHLDGQLSLLFPNELLLTVDMPEECDYGQAPPKEVGEAIPADSVHAVSVALPTWSSNVAYEEGEEWVHRKMKSGYPRFRIHDKICGV